MNRNEIIVIGVLCFTVVGCEVPTDFSASGDGNGDGIGVVAVPSSSPSPLSPSPGPSVAANGSSGAGVISCSQAASAPPGVSSCQWTAIQAACKAEKCVPGYDDQDCTDTESTQILAQAGFSKSGFSAVLFDNKGLDTKATFDVLVVTQTPPSNNGDCEVIPQYDDEEGAVVLSGGWWAPFYYDNYTYSGLPNGSSCQQNIVNWALDSAISSGFLTVGTASKYSASVIDQADLSNGSIAYRVAIAEKGVAQSYSYAGTIDYGTGGTGPLSAYVAVDSRCTLLGASSTTSASF